MWRIYGDVAESYGEDPEIDQTTASMRAVFIDLGVDLYDREQRDAILSTLAMFGHLDSLGVPHKAALGMLARTIVEAERTSNIRKG